MHLLADIENSTQYIPPLPIVTGFKVREVMTERLIH